MNDRRQNAVDRLYFWLGLFTDVYLVLTAFEFFANLHFIYPTFEKILNALSNPYLGALAVYVVLKELRKGRLETAISFHRGERYVVAWLVLLAVTTGAVLFSERYAFDEAYQSIIANGLAAFMIYLGTRIRKKF